MTGTIIRVAVATHAETAAVVHEKVLVADAVAPVARQRTQESVPADEAALRKIVVTSGGDRTTSPVSVPVAQVGATRSVTHDDFEPGWVRAGFHQ
jgi:hypothetical protein